MDFYFGGDDLRKYMSQNIRLIAVILLLIDVSITYWLDPRLTALILLGIASIVIYVAFVSKFKIRSFPYITLISGLISLLLAIIYFTNPASEAYIIELMGYYAYYFGVVGYTFGIVSFFLVKDKLSIVYSIIGIIAASPLFLFATLIRIFGWIEV